MGEEQRERNNGRTKVDNDGGRKRAGVGVICETDAVTGQYGFSTGSVLHAEDVQVSGKQFLQVLAVADYGACNDFQCANIVNNLNIGVILVSV